MARFNELEEVNSKEKVVFQFKHLYLLIEEGNSFQTAEIVKSKKCYNILYSESKEKYQKA